MAKERAKMNAVQFSERVAQHIADHALVGVTLRLFGTKRIGNGYRATDQWIGQVHWSPIQDSDDQLADAFHVGEFLSNSPKAEQQLPRLQLGKNYSIRAYDPDSNEQIAECICVVGEDDPELEDGPSDPFSGIGQRVQEVFVNKVLNEMNETVGMLSGEKATNSRRGPAAREDQDLVRLDNGTFVTREWLMADLARQRVQNRRLEDELGAIKDYLSNPADQEPDDPTPKNGIGSQLVEVGARLLGQFLQNRNSGGGSAAAGPTGIPGLDQIFGALRQATPQTVGGLGTSNFDNGNPFSSLLAGGSIDLRTPPTAAGPPQMGPMMQPGMHPMVNPMQGMQMPQPQQGMGFPTQGPMMAPSSSQGYSQPQNPYGQFSQGGFNAQQIQGAGSPPGFNHRRPTIEDDDDYDYDEDEGEFDMSGTPSPEVQELSRSLFEVIMQAYGQGGREQAKLVASSQFIPLALRAGMSKQALLLMGANPENAANIIFEALPKDVKAFIGPLESKLRPLVVEVAKGIDWNRELS